MKPDIILVEPMMPEIETDLDDAYQVHRLFVPEDARRIDEIAGQVRAVVTGGGAGLDDGWIDRLPSLGVIAVNGVGTDKVNLEKARARGVSVTTTPGVLTDDVADIGMALILAVLRQVTGGDRLVRSGGWAAGGKLPLGTSLKGKRLGILGLGQIGRALAVRGEAFGMNVGFYNRSPLAGLAWKKAETPAELARESDILAVCVAGTEATRNMVDDSVLDALGPEGVLVNVSRGSVVDEDALIDALREGRIGAAGLDVFVGEPRIRTEFLALENVVLAPHQGSATVETRRAMGRLVLENLSAFFAGREPPTDILKAR